MKKQVSIRTRITTTFLISLCMVFVVVAVFFNLTINSYIDSEIVNQLDQAVTWVEMFFPKEDSGEGEPPTREGEATLPEMAEGARVIARSVSQLSQVQAFVVNSTHTLQVSREGENGTVTEEMLGILKEAKARKIELDDKKQHNIRANGREYVLTGTQIQLRWVYEDIPVSESEMTVVFYIDNTGLNLLTRRVNRFLLLIILLTGAAAVVVITFVTKRMVRPIRELSRFAVAIGNGDFRRRKIVTRETELIELGESMNQTAGHLERYDSEQKLFFQNVSHELRTPLMSIKGYAEGVKYHMFENNDEPADVILAEADRLTEMVEDLIYVSKIDSIKTDTVYAEADLREILSQCGNNLKGVVFNSGITIEYHFPEHPVLILCDERQWEKAFGNILSNGLRFAKTRIDVTCSETSEEAIVAVQDDGEGIEPESLPHIFERFFKGKKGKHGIGMAIAKSVFENHGGAITAENNETGALFLVRLPKRKGGEENGTVYPDGTAAGQ